MNLSPEKRESCFDICATFIRRQLNVEDRTAIIALGYILQEIEEDELQKIKASNFLIKDVQIETLICNYIESHWDEHDNVDYQDFFTVKEFYKNILFFRKKVNWSLVKEAWIECIIALDTTEKKAVSKSSDLKGKSFLWIISGSSVFLIFLVVVNSLINGKLTRVLSTKGLRDVSIPVSTMKTKLLDYGFQIESTETDRCNRYIYDSPISAAGIYDSQKNLICLREEYFYSNDIYSSKVLTHEAVHGIQDCIRESPTNGSNQLVIGEEFGVDDIVDDFLNSPRGDMTTISQYDTDPYYEKEAVALEDQQQLVFNTLLPNLCSHRLND